MVKILIVEDDTQLRDELGEFLEEEGYEVVYASNGKEALEILNDAETDLVITDLVMPGMDGMDILTEMKRLNLNIPVIMITAFATVKSAVEAMKRGARDYIEKPFNLKEVEATVRKVLEEARLMAEQDKMKSKSFFEKMMMDSKVLNSSIRRDIIKSLGLAQKLRFTELKKMLRIDSPPLLSFHLRILKDAGLVKQDTDRNYYLSSNGMKVFRKLMKISEKVESILEGAKDA